MKAERIDIQVLGTADAGRFVPAATPCEFSLECHEFVIGSAPHSTPHVRLDDPTVSRRHIVVELIDEGRWRVCDVGSDNGTLHIRSLDADNWLDGADRVMEVEITQPEPFLIGRVVVRLTPVASEAALAETTPVGQTTDQ